MPQHYHSSLVLMSLLVAILASYTALTLALRIRVATELAARAWLVGGGFAMGFGIWAMHFIGMLALRLPIEIAYDVWLTLVSLAIAVVVSTFALHLASRRRVTRAALISAGIAMGIGICAMHYVGMAAIEISPRIRYDPWWVSASFAIAIAASFVALWLVFTSREDAVWWRSRGVLGAVVMGFAITGMHYAGMLAAQFPPNAMSNASAVANRNWLAGSLTMITLFVLAGTLLLSFTQRRTASIRASLMEAKESSRAKDEFLAMLGHELRNPLASISNAVFLLDRAEPKGSEWQFARDVIARQSAHLGKIVDDLLDVGRAVTGKMSINLKAVDVGRAVESALRGLRAAGKTAGRNVEYEGGGAWVRADRTRIEQVVTNLVLNAVQHTAGGGRIALRVATSGGEAILAVADDGVGMDADTAAKAFDLFFQAEQGRGGLGIGLTIARRIVEVHGGSISVASEGPGKGTTFTVRLPLIEPTRDERREAARPEPRRSRSVVIVEDAPDSRLSLQKIFEHEGHSVRTAVDGRSGLEAILQEKPDVAVIDIGLPQIDGYEVARCARAAGIDAYLIALTGYGRAEDKEQAREAGFDLHMTKPPAMERLLALVAEAPRGAGVAA